MNALKEIMKTDKKAKVIMVTAIGQDQMVQEAMKAGAKGYVVKPFDEAKLVETVEKVLG